MNIADLISCFHTNDREGSQTDGIQKNHYFLIIKQCLAVKHLFFDIKNNKKYHRCQNRILYINRVLEGIRRVNAQHQIPDNSAPDSGHDSHHNNPQNIHFFADANHSTG